MKSSASREVISYACCLALLVLSSCIRLLEVRDTVYVTGSRQPIGAACARRAHSNLTQ